MQAPLGCQSVNVNADSFLIRGQRGAINAKMNGTDAYCTSLEACEYASMHVTNLYCLGSSSCRFVTGVFFDVFSGAFESLHGSTIETIFGSLYCTGYLACWQNTFQFIGDSVYAKGYQVLFYSVFDSVYNKIAAFGYQALLLATINNTASLLCDGDFCLEQAQITSVATIKVNGTGALTDAVIETNLDGEDFILEVYDDNKNGSFSVTCSHNDTCYIGCWTESACTQMNLFCIGICFVDCSHDNCPNVLQGQFEDWTSM